MIKSLSDYSAHLSSFYKQSDNEIAVGLSGGPDSMALCHMLSTSYQGKVHAIYVHHGLRLEAEQEAKDIEAWIKDWPQITFKILRRDSENISDSKVQESAREDRYKLISEYCAQNNISQLYLAHHQDDQAETFLFRLAKGSGLDGLCAMSAISTYNENLSLIRPLLHTPKVELVEYCNSQNISFLKDPSNEDVKYARVRIRKARQVLEEEGLSSKRLDITAKRLMRARKSLEHYTQLAFSKALYQHSETMLSFDFQALADEPEEIRLRVILKTLSRIGETGSYGPRLEKVEDLLARIFDREDFVKSSLGGCLIDVDRKKGLLTIEKEHI